MRRAAAQRTGLTVQKRTDFSVELQSHEHTMAARSRRAQRAVSDLGLDPIEQAARDVPVFFSHQRGRRGPSR